MMSEKTKQLAEATPEEQFESIKDMVIGLAHKNRRIHGGDIEDIIGEAYLIAWETIEKGLWNPEKGALTTFMHYRVSLKLLNYQKKRFRIGGLSNAHVPINAQIIEGEDLAALESIDLIDELSPEAAELLSHITTSRARSWGGVKALSLSKELEVPLHQVYASLGEILDALYNPMGADDYPYEDDDTQY